MAYDLAGVGGKFQLASAFKSGIPYGSGHINDTFKVDCEAGDEYILQRVNTAIFRQPEALMENFRRVTAHIGAKIAAERSRNPGCRRRALQLIAARDGKPFLRDAEGNFWRCYIFVGGARTYDIMDSVEHAYQAARAFGAFQNDLADLPAPPLHETIVGFHHTPGRLANLKRAAAADKCGRLKEVGPEMEFVLKREAECSRLVDLRNSGEIRERITHNDTKLNNVLIDDETGEGICVIDLDTAMPGLPHYDFGDMVRTGTNSAAEDEKNLDLIEMRFPFFEALLRGYLASAGAFLSPLEKSLLPFSGKLITLETGIRFLTDYLEGDLYFKTKRPGHNLDRCRTQFKLVDSIERNFDAMRRLCDSL